MPHDENGFSTNVSERACPARGEPRRNIGARMDAAFGSGNQPGCAAQRRSNKMATQRVAECAGKPGRETNRSSSSTPPEVAQSALRERVRLLAVGQNRR